MVKLSLRTSDFRFETTDGYDVIKSQRDKMAQIVIPGHPQLPTWNPAYIIPYWKDIAYCQVVALDSVQIPGTWNIHPAQQEVPIGDSADWTPPDSAIYNSDSLYPGKLLDLAGSGAFDGARIVNLPIYPISYRPKSGRLFLYTSATVKLVFKDAEPPINAKQRYAHIQEIYDRMMADLVENDGDIGAWYRRPVIIDPNGEKSLIPAYIIVTTQAQSTDASLLAYRDWMYQRGYPTTIQTIEWVLANYTGVDPADELRKYILDCYQLGVSYFLFLGHEDNVPYRKLGPAATGWGPYDSNWQRWCVIPSDLYFSDLTINWNPNGDGYYGAYGFSSQGIPNDISEDSLIIPDVFIGRVVARTVADTNEVANWVTKVLDYEKNPGNTAGMNRVLHSSDDDFDAEVDLLKTYYPLNFVQIEAYSSTSTLYEINHNCYGWMNTIAHGLWNRCWVLDWQNGQPVDQFFSFPQWPGTDLSELINENAYFIHYSVACEQTCYDDFGLGSPDYPNTDTTIGEGFVEAYPNRGAVASFTNTRLGWDANLEIEQAFLEAIFDNNIWQLGPADAESKSLNLEVQGWPGQEFYAKYTVNLFGAPPTEAWTDVPTMSTTITASPNTIQKDVPTNITVSARYGTKITYPLVGAMVTLYGCGVYKMGTTGPNGQYLFTGVKATSAGTIVATATKHSYKPAQANITVTARAVLASDVRFPDEFFMTLSSSNPLKGDLKLEYGIPFEDEGLVSLKIYDVSGRCVQTVFSEEKTAGYYDLLVPFSSLSAGSYFIRLEIRNKAITEKMIKGGE